MSSNRNEWTVGFFIFLNLFAGGAFIYAGFIEKDAALFAVAIANITLAYFMVTGQ